MGETKAIHAVFVGTIVHLCIHSLAQLGARIHQVHRIDLKYYDEKGECLQHDNVYPDYKEVNNVQ